MMNFLLEEIESCERIGDFDDEYVYDIQIDGDIPTFIANDILVHNSAYVSFENVIDSCNWQGNPIELIIKINEFGFREYLEKKMEEYSKKWHTDNNYQDFELESVSSQGILLEKKKYIFEMGWEAAAGGGIYYEPLSHMIYKGVELAQGVTSPFARKKLDELVKYIFSNRNVQTSEIAAMLKAYKAEFKVSEPDHICNAKGISDYTKSIANDVTRVEVMPKCPFHVRAAAYYNFALNSNAKYKEKYELIKSGSKVKFYYTDNDEENTFAYLPGYFPYEFAPKIDYNTQFSKTIIDPLNRILKALDLPIISSTLSYPTALF